MYNDYNTTFNSLDGYIRYGLDTITNLQIRINKWFYNIGSEELVIR